MPLQKDNLKNAILAIMDDLSTRETDPAQARIDFAIALSNAIDTFVKTGQVVYTAGLVAGSNPVTGVFEGNIT